MGYLRSLSTSEYSFKSFDCLTFTNECWVRMYGKPWCADLHDLYTDDGEHTPKALEVGFPDLFKAVSHYLTPSASTNYGSLVFLRLPNSKPLGGAFGICLGLKSVFVASQGIVYLSTKFVERSWNA